MSRPRIRLPLPSACSGCGTTIHAIRNSRHDQTAAENVVWVHDATLASTTRKGGSHSATPDPNYKPQRARTVGFRFHPEDPLSGGFTVEASLLA